MRLLLDTHAFLWWITADAKLSKTAQTVLSDPKTIPVLSAASGWEIAIKYAIGKLPLPEAPSVYIPAHIVRNGVVELAITMDHALHTHTLPLHHRDPFDRMLVAQSQLEDIPIITSDLLISQYSVPIVW